MKPGFRDLLEECRRVYRKVGLWELLDKAGKWLIEHVCSEVILLRMEIALDSPFNIREPRIPITVRFAEPGDLERLRRAPASSRIRQSSRLENVSSLLRSGDAGFVALCEDEIAGYAWVSIGPTPKIAQWNVQLSTKDAYIHTAYTVPQFRRQGIHSTLNDHRIRFAQEKGCRRAYVLVLADNKGALRSDELTGFKRVARLVRWRFLGKEIIRHYPIEAD